MFNWAPYMCKVKELQLKSLQVEQWRGLWKIRASRSLVLMFYWHNFQNTSLLKRSLKLKLHQLTAYNRCIAAARRWKCSSWKQSLLPRTSLCAPAMEQHSHPEPLSHSCTYLKITVIIRFPIVIPVPAESLPHCTHLHPAQVSIALLQHSKHSTQLKWHMLTVNECGNCWPQGRTAWSPSRKLDYTLSGRGCNEGAVRLTGDEWMALTHLVLTGIGEEHRGGGVCCIWPYSFSFSTRIC